jgi:hypothetical protein
MLPEPFKTRKRQIDFHSLHNFGFQGPPPALLKLIKSGPPTKRARVNAAKSSQKFIANLLQATILINNKEDVALE